MTLNANHFIAALEIGQNNLDSGVSYNKMIELLASKGWTNVNNPSFRKWFYTSFYCSSYWKQNEAGWESLGYISPSAEYDTQDAILEGEAYFKYLEYVEIKHALSNSRTSTIIAILAIILSCLVGALQIITTLRQK